MRRGTRLSSQTAPRKRRCKLSSRRTSKRSTSFRRGFLTLIHHGPEPAPENFTFASNSHLLTLNRLPELRPLQCQKLRFSGASCWRE